MRTLWVGTVVAWSMGGIIAMASMGSARAATDAPRLLTVAQAGDSPHEETSYIGNAGSKKYHKSSCRLAKKIRANNSVSFSSIEQAQQAGYTACKSCFSSKRGQQRAAADSAAM